MVSVASIAVLATVWYGLLFAFGRPWSAAIPLGYQLVSFTAIAVLARTGRFVAFLNLEIAMMFVLPAFLQWSLGGFTSSGAMITWGATTAISARLWGARPDLLFVAFAVLVGTSAVLDPWLVENVEQLSRSASLTLFAINICGASMVAVLVIRYFIAQRDRARGELEMERARSDRLLLNVLPEPIAERLKAGESTIADAADSVTVLFADIVGFTPLASGLSPQEVVGVLNRVFTTLDELCVRHSLEKIKTIGDEYMVVGGLPTPQPDHADLVAAFALDALVAVAALPDPLQMRIGMATGPVIAGVIGLSKFSYDLWGDTVNTASRMESHGVPGRIQVNDACREALRATCTFETMGTVEIKGKGPMTTHFLVARSS